VVNLGNTPAPESMLRYYLSENNTYGSGDIELGADIVESLDSGQVSFQQDTLLIPANTEAGQWFIIFMADADFNLMEFDESNNQAYLVINVLVSPPDLVVQGAEADPLIIEPGGTTNTVCDVYNLGDGEAESSILNYYLSANITFEVEDLLLDYNDVGSLEPGESSNESITLEIPSSTLPGEWYILFFADAEYQVDESDENNNIASVQITVDDPFYISDNINNNLKVYPNPLKENLNIDISDLAEKPVSLEIITSKGNLVRQYAVSQLNPGVLSFNLKDLASGVYVIRIKFENNAAKEVTVVKE
jgi:subtilase family serine protease